MPNDAGADGNPRLRADGASLWRVLLFSAAPKADAAGVQRVMLDLASYLRGRGQTVATAWPDGDGTGDDWRLPLEAAVGPSGRPGPAAIVRGARDAVALATRLARFRPDVVNLHYPRGQTLYFMLLRNVFGYKLVLSFHNTDLHGASGAVLARLPNWLRAADAVTTVSADLAAGLRRHAPDLSPVVIPNGIDIAWWTPDAKVARDPLLAVAAGRLIGMKGFDHLLEAFAAAAPKGARLVVAGDGEDRTALVAQAERLGLQQRVQFPGRLDGEALRALFRRAGLFVLSSRREGMPLVLIEALACGLPAVATAVNGVADVMTPDCGEVVAAEDPGALAAAIARRLGDAGRLAQEGEAARRRALRFNAAETYAAYERVLLESR